MQYFGIESNSKKVKARVDTGSDILDCFLYALFYAISNKVANISISCNKAKGTVEIRRVPSGQILVYANGPRGSRKVTYRRLGENGLVTWGNITVNGKNDLKEVNKNMGSLLDLIQSRKPPKEEKPQVKAKGKSKAKKGDKLEKIALPGPKTTEQGLRLLQSLTNKVYGALSAEFRVELSSDDVTGFYIKPSGSEKPICHFRLMEDQSTICLLIYNGFSMVGVAEDYRIKNENEKIVAVAIAKAKERAIALNTPGAKKVTKLAAPGKLSPKGNPPLLQRQGDAIPPCAKIEIHDKWMTYADQKYLRFPIVTKGGEVRYTSSSFSVHHDNRDIYHINKSSYKAASQTGHVLLRDTSKVAKQKNGESFEDLQAESEIKQIGYSVDQRIGLSEVQRQWILYYIVKMGIRTAGQLEHFIRWVIAMHPGKQNELARDKWNDDIRFLWTIKT